MNDCKFAENCGGGHTTAQHHLHVYERVIKNEAGLEAYYAIEEAVNFAATVQKMDNKENNNDDRT